VKARVSEKDESLERPLPLAAWFMAFGEWQKLSGRLLLVKGNLALTGFSRQEIGSKSDWGWQFPSVTDTVKT
jgi:hypothetical protein